MSQDSPIKKLEKRVGRLEMLIVIAAAVGVIFGATGAWGYAVEKTAITHVLNTVKETNDAVAQLKPAALSSERESLVVSFKAQANEIVAAELKKLGVYKYTYLTGPSDNQPNVRYFEIANAPADYDPVLVAVHYVCAQRGGDKAGNPGTYSGDAGASATQSQGKDIRGVSAPSLLQWDGSRLLIGVRQYFDCAVFVRVRSKSG